MKLEIMNDGIWLASGYGPRRMMLAEGSSYNDALYAWVEMYREQAHE